MLELNKIHQGDCLEVLKGLPDNSVDSVVTDPPYGLSFMGKKWDYDVPKVDVWKEVLRVLKPGGHLLSFAGTRTYHRMAVNVEDAGFEIRDMISWLYGSGLPKSLSIGKQIDKVSKRVNMFEPFAQYLKGQRLKLNIPQNQISKHFPSKTGGLTGCVSNWELGMNVPTKEQWIILKRELNLNSKFDDLINRVETERMVIGNKPWDTPVNGFLPDGMDKSERKQLVDTAPSSPEAKEWEGWGTALKPACEPIVVARKPLSEKIVALNVLKWGTGGINIDACRIGGSMGKDGALSKPRRTDNTKFGKSNETINPQSPFGRFPANIIFDEIAGKLLDEQTGNLKGDSLNRKKRENSGGSTLYEGGWKSEQTAGFTDVGGASRFFYCAKASKSERNKGCEELEQKDAPASARSKPAEGRENVLGKPRANPHPTVKPIKLMEYLIKLVTREGGVVLDPFMGSGSTAVACVRLGRNFVGIEKEKEYIKIINARLSQVNLLSFGGQE